MAKIFVLDDDQEILNLIETILTDEGHHVLTATEGIQAKFKLINDKFDLVILDLKLSEITGSMILRQLITGGGVNKLCPTIVVSGFIDDEIIKMCEGHPQIQLIPKPVHAQDLIRTTKTLLGEKIEEQNPTDFKFVNPIIESIVPVVEKLSKIKLTPNKPHVRTPTEISGDISGVIGVISIGFKGSVSLSFTEASFLKYCSSVQQQTITHIQDEHKELIEDLLNEVIHHAKQKLSETGLEIQTSIPTILLQKGHTLAHHIQFPTIVVEFKNDEMGICKAEVCLRT